MQTAINPNRLLLYGLYSMYPPKDPEHLSDAYIKRLSLQMKQRCHVQWDQKYNRYSHHHRN